MKPLTYALFARLFLAALFIIFQFSTGTIYSAWFVQNSGTTSNLNSVYFPVLNTGYVAGDNGTILKTTNGGIWQRLNTPTTSNLYSVFFIDVNNGYAAGDNVILKTIDGGNSWSAFNVTGYSLKSIYFISSNTGFAAGYNGIYLKTTNSGVTWQQSVQSQFNNCNAIYFINALTGFMAGNAGFYQKTTDGGSTWMDKTITANKNFYSIQFLNSNSGYITGGWVVSNFLRTNDCGENWENLSTQEMGPRLFSGYFTDIDNGYTVGRNGTILRTNNRGVNWSAETSGTSLSLLSVNFVNPQVGYIAGENGTILSTISVIGLIPIIKEEPKYFRLYQNFPNPFNPVTKINFDVPKSSFVNLAIYNVLGEVQLTLVNQQLLAGTYETDFDASNYPSGTYFYKLQAGDFVETKKMIVIK